MCLFFEEMFVDIYDVGEGFEIVVFFDFDCIFIQGYFVMFVM